MNLYEFCQANRGAHEVEELAAKWAEVYALPVEFSQFAKWLANLQGHGLVQILSLPSGYAIRATGAKVDGVACVAVLRVFSDAVYASAVSAQAAA